MFPAYAHPAAPQAVPGLYPEPPGGRRTRTALALLTVAVLLAHGVLLYRVPVSVSSHGVESGDVFATRMIAATAAPAPLPPAPAEPPTQPDAEATQRPVPRDTQARPAAAQRASAGTADGDAASQLAQRSVELQIGELPLSTDEEVHQAATAPASAPVWTPSPPPPSPPAAIPAPLRPAASKVAQAFAIPAPARLKYKINGEVKGFPYFVNGELLWQHDGKTYDTRLEVRHFLLGSRVQTSRGDITAQGLEPLRFGDKVRSEVAAHFERAKGKVSFSANTPDVPLLPGMQDHVSVFMQLAAMIGGAPGDFPEGTTLPFEAVGPRSVESWVFKVGKPEKLDLPGGSVTALKLSRDAVGEYGTRGEVWLAPAMGYLPVRIRVTEANGNFVDQQWAETLPP